MKKRLEDILSHKVRAYSSDAAKDSAVFYASRIKSLLTIVLCLLLIGTAQAKGLKPLFSTNVITAIPPLTYVLTVPIPLVPQVRKFLPPNIELHMKTEFQGASSTITGTESAIARPGSMSVQFELSFPIAYKGRRKIDNSIYDFSNEKVHDLQGVVEGLGSWYDCCNPRTANGDKFTPNSSTDFTVASKYLPFGTKLKITNLENGKSVVARVNDRGPYVKGRMIDLTKATAIALGYLEKGVAKLRIEKYDVAINGDRSR